MPILGIWTWFLAGLFLISGAFRLIRFNLTDESSTIDFGDVEVTLSSELTFTIRNTGDGPLVFLCCCAPAYEHDDTVLVE